MKIDFNTVSIGKHTGYGNASRLLQEALKNQGIEICPDSDVMLNFCMPPAYKGSDITIGYTPWESTEVPKDWPYGLRAVDELWSTSTWSADILSQYRQDVVKVLPHGVERCWKPLRHARGEVFTFLHVGEPAERKGGDIVLQAWWSHFRHRKDVRLIYKCIKYPSCRIKDGSGSIIGSPESIENISTITNIMTQPQLLALYDNVQAMVYPTRGEGFGLIPLEAMASGLPTIIPNQGGTADFSKYSSFQLRNSGWVESPESHIHPGLWMEHSIDELISLMEEIITNYDKVSSRAYFEAFQIHDDYDWNLIGELAADYLKPYL